MYSNYEEKLSDFIYEKLKLKLKFKIINESLEIYDTLINRNIVIDFDIKKETPQKLIEKDFTKAVSASCDCTIHNKTGFYSNNYCEFLFKGLVKEDWDEIIKKVNAVANGEFEILSETKPSNLYDLIYNFNKRNYGNDKTLKLTGVDSGNYLDCLNKTILIINSFMINKEPSYSLNLFALDSITTFSKYFKLEGLEWKRKNQLNTFNSLQTIYYISSFSSADLYFEKFLQKYRTIEATYSQKIHAHRNLTQLFKDISYKISNPNLNEKKIIKARDMLVHNETNINQTIIMKDNEFFINEVSKELNILFKEILLHANLIPSKNNSKDIPSFKGCINEKSYLFDEKSGYLEVNLSGMFLNELFSDSEFQKQNFTRNNGEKFIYEISEPSKIYKAEYIESIYTLKIWKTDRKKFYEDIYYILNHFALIVLENMTDDIDMEYMGNLIFPQVVNTDKLFYEKYSNVKYSSLKTITDTRNINSTNIHHFNEAIRASRNLQFESYYLFIQSFFTSNYSSHTVQVRNIIRKYFPDISIEIKKIYAKNFKIPLSELNAEKTAKIFTNYRNNSFHSNLEKGIQQMFHFDNEKLIQTMMAREICIHLLNDKCIR